MIKRPFTLLLLAGLLLSGCSRESTGYLAADLVQEGKTVKWPDGRQIQVRRRQGNKLDGVRLVQEGLPGAERTVEAEHGLISRDEDGHTVRVTLYDAVLRQGGRPVGSIKELSVICRD
jgi:hypothetical protein